MKWCLLLAALAGCHARKVESGTEAGTTTAPLAPSIDASAPQRIGGDRARPDDVAIDAESVYWTTNWDLMGVRRLPRSALDGPPVTLCKLPDRFTMTEKLVVTDTHVYFVGSKPGAAYLYRVAKTATEAPCEKVAEFAGGGTGRPLVRSGTRVVMAAANDKQGSTILSLSDSGVRTLAQTPKPVDALTSDGVNVYAAAAWPPRALYKLEPNATEIGAAGAPLQFAAGKLFFVGVDNGLFSCPTTGGASKRVGDGRVTAGFLIVGDTVYTSYTFSARSGGFTLRKGSIRDGALVDHGSFRDTFRGIAADSRDLFVATSTELFRLTP